MSRPLYRTSKNDVFVHESIPIIDRKYALFFRLNVQMWVFTSCICTSGVRTLRDSERFEKQGHYNKQVC